MNNLKTKKLRVPIAVKLIFIVIFFLAGTTIYFARQSSSLFEQVLVQREEDSNLATASARLKEVDAALVNAKEKIEVVGTLLAKQGNEQKKEDNNISEFEINFKN